MHGHRVVAAVEGLAIPRREPGHLLKPGGVGDLVIPSQGEAVRLQAEPRDQQAALQALPPAARGGLPAMICEDGLITCPALDGTAANLIPDRLAAAAGLVDRELRQASLPRA